jgi:hypothetical protein
MVHRCVWVLIGALLCAATIGGCDSHDDETLTVTRLPAVFAEPDPVNGGRIMDVEGREVLLRGVNVNALVEYWPYGDCRRPFRSPRTMPI